MRLQPLRISLYLSLLFFLLSPSCFAQKDLKYLQYDTDLLTKEFHKGRREAVRNQMPAESMAVFFAAPERNRANDDDYQYHQDPSFYYLTGCIEPNSLLLIFKDKQTIGGIQANEFLFVQDKDPKEEV